MWRNNLVITPRLPPPKPKVKQVRFAEKDEVRTVYMTAWCRPPTPLHPSSRTDLWPTDEIAALTLRDGPSSSLISDQQISQPRAAPVPPSTITKSACYVPRVTAHSQPDSDLQPTLPKSALANTVSPATPESTSRIPGWLHTPKPSHTPNSLPPFSTTASKASPSPIGALTPVSSNSSRSSNSSLDSLRTSDILSWRPNFSSATSPSTVHSDLFNFSKGLPFPGTARAKLRSKAEIVAHFRGQARPTRAPPSSKPVTTPSSASRPYKPLPGPGTPSQRSRICPAKQEILDRLPSTQNTRSTPSPLKPFPTPPATTAPFRLLPKPTLPLLSRPLPDLSGPSGPHPSTISAAALVQPGPSNPVVSHNTSSSLLQPPAKRTADPMLPPQSIPPSKRRKTEDSQRFRPPPPLRTPSLTPTSTSASSASLRSVSLSSIGSQDSPIIVESDDEMDDTSRRRFNKVLTLSGPTSPPLLTADKRPPLPTPPQSPCPSSLRASSPQPALNQLFMVGLIEGKGQGMFATQPIKRGTLIIREAPFMTIDVENDDATFEDIWPEYEALSKAKQLLFKTCHRRTDEGAPKDHLVNIVDTNSIPLENDQSNNRQLGMFKTLCRMNHACTPNAGWKWYPEEKLLYLHAFTDIAPNTEITVSYTNRIARPKKNRQKLLLDGYGFSCRCQSCSAPQAQRDKDDDNLRMYGSIRRKWNEQSIDVYAKDLRKALMDIDLALDIVNQLGLWDERGEIYSVEFEVYALHGMDEEAKEAAQKALSHYTVIWGQGMAETTSFDAQARDPTVYGNWGLLKRETNTKKGKGVPRGSKGSRGKIVKKEQDDVMPRIPKMEIKAEGAFVEDEESDAEQKGVVVTRPRIKLWVAEISEEEEESTRAKKRHRRWSNDREKPIKWWQDGPWDPKRRR